MTRESETLGVTEVREPEAPSADSRFYALLRDSISEGMTMVLGEDGARAMSHHLDLPSLDDPKEFHERLAEIFGLGTASLERVILRQLRQGVGLGQASDNDDDFLSQVELAKRSFHAGERARG